MPLITGTVLSTVKMALGPVANAVLPARLLAVAAPMLIPMVPSPLMAETVTVRPAVPLPLTATLPVALPLVARVTSPAARVMLSAAV